MDGVFVQTAFGLVSHFRNPYMQLHNIMQVHTQHITSSRFQNILSFSWNRARFTINFYVDISSELNSLNYKCLFQYKWSYIFALAPHLIYGLMG